MIRLGGPDTRHFTNQEWQNCINFYTRALSMKPGHAILYSNRAICEIQLKNFESALKDAECAIRLNPKNVEFYQILSEALMGLQSFEAALKTCNEGLKLNPREPALLAHQQHCKSKISGCQTSEITSASQENDEEGCTTEKKSKIEFDVVTPEDVQILTDREMNDGIMFDFILDVLKPHFNKQVFLQFLEFAKNDNPRALYHLGNMHKNGYAGLCRDPLKALELWKEAASHKPYLQHNSEIIPNPGVSVAEFDIGDAYRVGSGVERDYVEAMKWYTKSARHGFAESCAIVGSFLVRGLGCDKDPAAAKLWFAKNSEFQEGPCSDDEDYVDSEEELDEEEDEDSEEESYADLEEVYNDDPQFEWICMIQAQMGNLSYMNGCNSESDPNKLLPAMKDRLSRGWPSAKLFFEAYQKLKEAHELLSQKKFTESFVKVRELMSIWNLKKLFDPMPFKDAAVQVLKKEPNNHAALYIITAYSTEPDHKKRQISAKRLVKLNPSIPEYHVTLGTTHAYQNEGNPAVRSLDKSLKIRPHREVMCLRAVYLRNIAQAKDEIVTDAFQQFLSSVPSDYMRVPDAYFQLGNTISLKDPVKAAALYRLGQVADHPSIRLPCLPDLEDHWVRLNLKNVLKSKGYWPIPENILDRIKMCFTCTKTESLSPCTTCHKAWYCSKQCQENNLIIHKRFCHN